MVTDLVSNREQLRDRCDFDLSWGISSSSLMSRSSGEGCVLAAVLCSCDWSHRDVCGRYSLENINTDKPITG